MNEILEFQLSKVGFPIRKSVDQSFFAAPHGLSQRSTSFIASQRQGIHRTPLRHLIALIINVHTLGRMLAAHSLMKSKLHRHAPSMNAACGWTLIRKTSLLRKIEPIARRSSFANRIIYNSLILQMFVCRTRERRNDLEIVIGISANCFARSQTRIDLLFTMSEIPQARPEGQRMRSDVSRTKCFRPRSSIPSGGARRDRTDDLMLAKHALSQLSYGPVPEDECFTLAVETHSVKEIRARSKWWAWEDLNFRPHAYQARALTN
jgi:hypothetical protein